MVVSFLCRLLSVLASHSDNGLSRVDIGLWLLSSTGNKARNVRAPGTSERRNN